jgi:hypothetical protein
MAPLFSSVLAVAGVTPAGPVGYQASSYGEMSNIRQPHSAPGFRSRYGARFRVPPIAGCGTRNGPAMTQP